MDVSEVLQEISARLDYIEAYLVNLGQVAGYRYGPFSSRNLPPEVLGLLHLGKENDAIKLYRQLTDANFSQARDAIAEARAKGLA